MDAPRGIDETLPGTDVSERHWRLARFSGSALCALGASFSMPAMAGNLPVPCIAAGTCGVTTNWVTSGAATATQTANQLTINQTSQNAVLNWLSFNIGSGSSVNFVQPNTNSVAVNNIFQGSPSQIFGSLTANGHIYLINQNGILFGAGSQVNVGGLVASSLNITQSAVNNGIAGTIVGDPTTPSFVPFTDASGNPLPSGDVKVAQGAKLNATGGQIFLFAPNVSNEGTITTPNGQTILAAGSSIYLATSDDPNVRGLTVAVDAGGTVTNGNAGNASVKDPSQLVGQIVAQHGNITLMGLAVNQQGLVSANTSVNANGTILLVAAARSNSGTVTLGPNSVTEAPLDTTDTTLAVDQTVQQKSTVKIEGYDVNVDSGSSITATSGIVNITAAAQGITSSIKATSLGTNSSQSDGSRLYIADDVSIDVSGATATLPMSANTLQVELRGSELADDPLQRNGPLRGQAVTVDTRQYGTASDGTQWVGTPLAELAADFATIQHGILQRNEAGGNVTLQSRGDVIVGSSSKINVSGGATDYQAGFLNTSVLVGANGQLYSISSANPNMVYSGVANTTSITLQDNRWGVNNTYYGIYGTGQGQYVPGYLQGADAGSLALNAPHVVFDGSLAANVQTGIYQRNPPTAASTFPDGTLQRPYDQAPLPGQLTVGSVNPGTQFTDQVLSSIVFGSGATLPTLHNADGTLFDPLSDPWPSTATESVLNPALIGANAAGIVTVDANEAISIPADVRLQLPAGGSFSALASTITVAGQIFGPGSAISLKTTPTVAALTGTGGITLASTAAFDVAGAWVNDNPALPNNPANAPLNLNGGSVSLVAVDGNIALAPGSLIDVSGGAQLQANGTLTAGKAGSITINASAPDYLSSTPQSLQPAEVSLGATLRGYGISKGGSLALSAGSFCLTSGAACSPLSADLTDHGTITLGPDFFSTGGFGSYTLNANFGGLEVTSGTVLAPVQANFLEPNLLLPSAATLSSVATTAVLPEIQRQPVNLALSAQFVPGAPGVAGQGAPIVTVQEFATAPSLSIDKGASIILDPQATLSLASNTRVLDDGSIQAPSGNVNMTVTNTLLEQDFIAGHQLWLGPDSVINVSGTVQAQLNSSGHTVGTVLPGGSVALTAQRGAVETEPGSLINVAGTSAILDIEQVDSSGVGKFMPTTVASVGGSLSIQAAEAAVLSGSMEAAAGNSSVAAGSFSLVLDSNARYGTPANLQLFVSNGTVPDWGYDARVIQLVPDSAPVVIGAGSDLPDGLSARGVVSAASLAAAGFDAVTLKAAALDGTSVGYTTLVPGQIQFGAGVHLSLGRSLTMNAGDFVSNGGSAVLSAPYISLGQGDPLYQTTTPVVAGTGSLRLNGGMIDLIGKSAFSGFADVTLDSSGDIRATGTLVAPESSGTAPPTNGTGSMSVSGSLDLIAQQVYPSTLSSFTFTSGVSGTGDIGISQADGTAAGFPLSAGGTLTFNASTVTQSGTIRAPLGSIVINATNITLAAGSTTSTSADGHVIPFGNTQGGGFDWTYTVPGGTLVFGTDGIPLPSQSIQLSGTAVNIAKGATVDMKGGGDLLATEFVPGPTGTQDVLGSGASFAIVPTSNLQYAPTDPYYSTGSTVSPGETIYLSGGGGVPAGTYAVLPARYALLPGAYYVTPVSGYQDLTPGRQVVQPDGTVVVAGSFGYAGTSLSASSRTSGFDIRVGGTATGTNTVQNLAQYTETSANSFFATQAAAANVQAQRLPQDSGYLELNATSQLILNATLEATPGKGGRGAAVDIASSDIRIVNGSDAPAPETGVLDLDANSLSQLGAESILIGGVRTETSKGLQITTQASDVEVASGADLKSPELLLTATNSVTVDGGATVGSSGSLPTSDKNILLSGDGALLRVAASGSPTTTRTGVDLTQGIPTQGTLTLMSGSTINAPGGSVAVDTSGAADFSGTLQLAGGSLGITGTLISLGDASSGTPGTVLPGSVLNSLSVANLSLSSQTSIDFYDGSSLSGTNIAMTAGALRGFEHTTLEVAASGELTLQGAASEYSAPAAGSNVAPVATGTGQIAFSGGSVTLDKGFLDLSGFTSTSVSSQGLMNLTGSGALKVPGDLHLQAGLLSADSGASHTFAVGGAFIYDPIANPTKITLPSEASLGATLEITAQSIAFNGSALLHAGELDLNATGAGGGVSLGSTAAVDLSAVNTVFNGLSVPSPAGILKLMSTSGSITAATGSAINVSALDSSVANSGALIVSAPGGNVSLLGQMIGKNASVGVDGQSLGDIPSLEAALVSGGFTGDWNLRLRGPGDLVVPASSADAIVGRSVTLTADQGNVDVEGTITSNGTSGGSIVLSASNDVVVNGTLDARPVGSGEMNGQIELATTGGRVLVGAGATIEAYDPSVAMQSVQDGGLWIRAPEDTVDTLLPGSSSAPGLVLAGDLTRLSSVTIEGFQKVPLQTAGTITAQDEANAYQAATNFMSNAPTLLQALSSMKGPSKVQIVPGVEIDQTDPTQSLTLNTDWDLSSWTFNGVNVPGVLTLRSAGDLNLNASISDGFSGTPSTAGASAYVLTSTGPSWSYRLVGGADLSSSNVMAVQPVATFANAPAGSPTGSVTLGAGTSTNMTMVRTGTGSISIAAASDVTLTNEDSVIYTAGIADTGVTFTKRGQLNGLLYPTEGGNISISAGKDVGYTQGGEHVSDLVTAWLWRVGNDQPTNPSQTVATAWTVNFAEFEQGIGALGGGNVSVTAGGNVMDLSVSVPTIGRQVGSTTSAGSSVQVLNEGNILIRAGQSVEGGSLYDGNGTAVVVAGNQITQSPTVANLYPMILLGDANVTLSARNGATLAGVANPTLLPQGSDQKATGNNISYFSTYGENASVTLQTTDGTAELVDDTGAQSVVVQNYSSIFFPSSGVVGSLNLDGKSALRIYPGSVTAASLRGNLNVDNSLTLYPEPNGTLNLLSHDTIQLSSAAGAAAGNGIGYFDLTVSNADPSLLPTVQNPQGSFDNVQLELDSVSQYQTVTPSVNAPTPVHLTGSTPDSTLSRIVSLTGDVTMLDPSGSSQVTFAGPAQITAGRDIVNLQVDFTNLEASDVSSLVAGRDITYPLGRQLNGSISQTSPGITIDGPGTLEVVAGRDINFGTGSGATSEGNQKDPGLASTGASVTLLAGIQDPLNPDYSTFISDYLSSPSSAYTSQLVSYMTPLMGTTPTAAQALTAFEALPASQQMPLIDAIFFAEIDASGKAAAAAGSTHNNFTRGYDAIEALFPKSVPFLNNNQPSPDSGNISLYFSRVYTLDGGDINLLAPGGYVNAGLATPPASFGIAKAPDQLGIVAETTGNVNAYTYGDFEVNASRVFAADGGNILIWSTDGNIDAGRGSKAAVSAPPPTITYDSSGQPTVTYAAALTGSGIQALSTTAGVPPGNVDLFAPNGVVNANDAGIVAGNLTIAATAVLGASNIKVSGVAIGVPVEASGLGASLASVSAVASSASQAATEAFQASQNKNTTITPVTDAAVGWLDVFVEGFGAEVCKPSDAECLKRQAQH